MAANAQLRMVLTQNTLSGVLDGILVIVYAALLLAISPVFGLVAAGLGLAQILLVVVPARRIAELTVAELTEAGWTSGFAAEALRGIDSVKAAGSEAWASFRQQQIHPGQAHPGPLPHRGHGRVRRPRPADLDHQSVRRQCGVVTQDVAVFNGTIRRNIAFGTPDLPLADVRRAAQLADLECDIATMPMGYETNISENGSALSGGQRQRLALARALVHNPAFLILDEATSALDTLSETTIARNLADAGITTITVAHRLSTIRHADTIVVFNKGVVAEIGDHHLLSAAGGLYAAMVNGAEIPA